MMQGDPFSQLSVPVRNCVRDMGWAEPTEIQKQAIPAILAGENVLLIAPTGTGKTEAAVLPIFDQLIRRRAAERIRGINILYVTPLRALNRDILRRLADMGSKLDISVEVRHGDTPQNTRRRQSIKPPNMLVTTPETLQAILPGRRMRQSLREVRWVVIDEIHELAESKRGVQLSIALERLQEIAGNEMQRIGLSATVGSPNEVARFLAGSVRTVKIVDVSARKENKYSVELPLAGDAEYEASVTLFTSPEAAARILRIQELVDLHQSTLIFVNSRQNAEMLGFRFTMLKSGIGIHHGSLSREQRHLVEDEFKAGKLKGIVCTSTLELGIDVGSVDLVVQYLSPRQVAPFVQRVGRSGHG
ncbi:DEAD/DEAH box helicase, partial [Candidatus Bathyarchaeota archaeon]|nr:DEAD/DEAH box helicase [Candidatus Bathyarchaeota archaeon]